MNTPYDRRADSELVGSPLRNEAAGYLEAVHGNASLEILVNDKRVDIVCRIKELGKATQLFVEVKDYEKHLGRSDVNSIHGDYESILRANPSSKLLLITRNGISSSAQSYIDHKHDMFHQTIWELEDGALGLLPYVAAQTHAFKEDGLSSYYVGARARQALYDLDHCRSLASDSFDLLADVEKWLAEPEAPPLAILGGYGAGKSSFAKRLLSRQANRAIADPSERRPILIRLGSITRSTGLDSLLGSLFTSEYEVRGYNFRRFCELNEKGRLLLILDGFDEMKHAMTWTEFLNEIRELNKLNVGKSKVILLGRPSAFTSDDEHLEVLRGRFRVDAGLTSRLPDWPEFREYELEAFTREERIEFVRRFLQTKLETPSRRPAISKDAVERRVAEVNRLADEDPDVFGKPVHARILVELALDADFDLAGLSGVVTRWTLYAQFFAMLARRETEKPARSPIEGQFRLAFLRRVARWLWTERDGSTAFRASELPNAIFDGLPDGDAETLADKRREYLAGAFLERKAQDNYFFPHRSFAEFLIAEDLASNPPGDRQHAEYAALVRDGVADFLVVAPASRTLGHWCRSLGAESGILPIDYFLFLADAAGGYARMLEHIPPKSCWHPYVRLLASHPEDLHERFKGFSDMILQEDHRTIAFVLSAMTRFHDLLPVQSDTAADHSPLQELTPVAAAALISRTVSLFREKQPGSRHTIEERHSPFLLLAKAATSVQTEDQSRIVQFSWAKLGEAAAALVDKIGPSLVIDTHQYEYRTMPSQRVPYFQVRELMPKRSSDFFHEVVLKRGSLDLVSVVSRVERRSSFREE